MLNSRRWKRTWWLGGLILVLALLGHDGLMASVAHAARSSSATATHEHAVAPQPATIITASPDEDQHPAHPTACGVAGVAVSGSGNQLELADLFVHVAFVGPDCFAAAHPTVQHWREPFWPPGTRRALLQVYRL